MEAWIGGLWHRLVTRAANGEHPEAAVRLTECARTLGILFRALGGDAGLRVAAANAVSHGARRRRLARLAGSGERMPLASVDGETLCLPPRIACFAEAALNRDLYLWLAALAAHADADGDWFAGNQRACLKTLSHLPGLRPRYERLVAALLASRIPPQALPEEEAAQEAALRRALLEPGSVAALPPLGRRGARPVQPVPLWLHPAPPTAGAKVSRRDTAGGEGEGGPPEPVAAGDARHRAERVALPDNASPLLFMFRAESLLSWAEYRKVNRALDDEANPDAGRAAADMDALALADGERRVGAAVRFDLDLPSAGEDDIPLGEGILLPEWDWRRQSLRPDFCRIQPMRARRAEALALPERLRRTAQTLRSRFAALAPARRWQKGQPDGSEIDIDACVRLHTDRLCGRHAHDGGAYLALRRRERDLACLVLADLSLSTEAWVDDERRVIDVIRDGLMLFGEAIEACGDRFALYGFSSLKRHQVRFYDIKPFDAPMDDSARGRIAALRPGYYTRLGAAIRHAAMLLERQPASLRLLLLLSDGKPHDIDHYEGRYGIEDTRMALMEARRKGLRPFCLTIDREGAGYLPHMFGAAGFSVIRDAAALPLHLPLLYARLTGDA